MSVVHESQMKVVEGNPMVVLFQKLERLKIVLKQFNEKYFSKISDRVKLKRLELEALQNAFLRGSSTEVKLQQEKVCIFELIDLIRDEEAFYKHKSRMTWLREGDSNTHFLHKIVFAKQRSQALTELRDDNGNIYHSFKDIIDVAENFFFQNLLGRRMM